MPQKNFFSKLLQRWSETTKPIKARPFFSASQSLLGLFLLCFPFQIRTLIYTNHLYINGNFNPFTSFFIYLNDLLLIASFCCWGVSLIFEPQYSVLENTKRRMNYGDKKITWSLFLILVVLLFNTIFVENKTLHLLNVFRFSELFLLYLLIVHNVLRRKTTLLLFIASMSFQALIAIFQYLFQHSLGLRILGESIASPETLGVAKIDLGGHKILRALGTFPHANILGGALSLGIIIVLLAFPKNWWIKGPCLVLFGIAFIFSFSRSAFFGLLACFLMFVVLKAHKKIPWRSIIVILSIALLLIVSLKLEKPIIQRLLFEDQTSTQERILYMEISQKMITTQPWGIGLGGFTNTMQKYSEIKLEPWMYQPVHNIFLLFSNEGGVEEGVLLIVVFIYIFYKFIQLKLSHREDSFFLGLIIIIATIGLVDHYFISLYPGQIMLFLTLGISSDVIAKATSRDFLSKKHRSA